MRFPGKVVLITGGGSGLGRAAALAFAREGASVLVADLDPNGARETVLQIGAKAAFLGADVTRGAECDAMVRHAVATFGRLDYAMNSAGIEGVRARVEDYPEEVWLRTVAVDLTGVFLSMKYEVPAMLASGGGSIVNVSSVAGMVGYPQHTAYSAAKHGVIGLTKSVALENARRGIRVNAICPAYTRTPMVQKLLDARPEMEQRVVDRIPIGRLATAEEIAESVLYLCSDAAGFVTGHAFALDGGLTAM